DMSWPPSIAPRNDQPCGAPLSRTTYFPGGTPIVANVPFGSTRPRAPLAPADVRPSAASSETEIEANLSEEGFSAEPVKLIVPFTFNAGRSVTATSAMSVWPTATDDSAQNVWSVGSGGG